MEQLPVETEAPAVGARLPEALTRELEAGLHEALEAVLQDELSLELRERLLARLKAELREDLQVRIARLKAELLAELLPAAAPASKPRQFERFGWNVRAQHLLLLSSCLLLILTGLPLKFHEARIAEIFFDLIGGVQTSTLLHRIGAVGLMLVGAYHVVYLLAFREGRRNFLALLPRPQDVLDLLQMLRYFLGRTDQRPRFGRFSYVEKFDYWAVYWGIVVMIGSGLILWFLETSLTFLPKFAADIAREAHSDEGLLATLAIIVWHFYNVHLNPEHFPMNWTFWTGMISEEEMRRHHPLEYEAAVAEPHGPAGPHPAPGLPSEQPEA